MMTATFGGVIGMITRIIEKTQPDFPCGAGVSLLASDRFFSFHRWIARNFVSIFAVFTFITSFKPPYVGAPTRQLASDRFSYHIPPIARKTRLSRDRDKTRNYSSRGHWSHNNRFFLSGHFRTTDNFNLIPAFKTKIIEPNVVEARPGDFLYLRF